MQMLLVFSTCAVALGVNAVYADPAIVMST